MDMPTRVGMDMTTMDTEEAIVQEEAMWIILTTTNVDLHKMKYSLYLICILIGFVQSPGITTS